MTEFANHKIQKVEQFLSDLHVPSFFDIPEYAELLQNYKDLSSYKGPINPNCDLPFIFNSIQKCCYYDGFILRDESERGGLPNGFGILHFHLENFKSHRRNSTLDITLYQYQGDFLNGRKNGFGAYTYKDLHIQGSWKEDQLEGKCVVQNQNCKIQGSFEQGQMEGDALIFVKDAQSSKDLIEIQTKWHQNKVIKLIQIKQIQ
eukprot:403343723